MRKEDTYLLLLLWVLPYKIEVREKEAMILKLFELTYEHLWEYLVQYQSLLTVREQLIF